MTIRDLEKVGKVNHIRCFNFSRDAKCSGFFFQVNRYNFFGKLNLFISFLVDEYKNYIPNGNTTFFFVIEMKPQGSQKLFVKLII